MHQIKFIVFKKVGLKKSLLSYSVTPFFSQKSLITICKALLRPLLDYGDVIYDQPHNESVCEKLESAQCKVALAITSAIQGTSRKKNPSRNRIRIT